MQVKLFFVTFNLNCRLCAVSVRKPSEWMSNFCTVQFLKTKDNQFLVFRTPLPYTPAKKGAAHVWVKCTVCVIPALLVSVLLAR